MPQEQPWWRRLLSGLLALLGRSPKALPAPSAAALPDDLRALRDSFTVEKGVVADTVGAAVEDYLHFRRVVLGPGATSDAVDDVSLLAEAEDSLRSILRRAPELQVLVEVAGKRSGDRSGREAAGDAILALRDQGRALHELASAALQWASTQSPADCRRMKDCATRL